MADNSNKISSSIKEVKDKINKRLGYIAKVLGDIHFSKRQIIITVLVAVLIASGVAYLFFRNFNAIQVVESYGEEMTGSSEYAQFGDNIIKYGSEGLSLITVEGEILWNESYVMVRPTVKISGRYAIIYDKSGSGVVLFDTAGVKRKSQTSVPLVAADVSDTGTVVTLTKDSSRYYIKLNDIDNILVAEGEVFVSNGGFPTAVAISNTAERVAISRLDVSEGEVNTNIVFYDFESNSAKKDDYVIANHTFKDRVFSQIEFVRNDKMIGFSDQEVVIFNYDAKASIRKEVKYDGEVSMVFSSDDRFGFVRTYTDDEGNVIEELDMYSEVGRRLYREEIESDYQTIELLGDGEVLLSDGYNITLVNEMGVTKFSYKFEDRVYAIVPAGLRRFYVYKENGIDYIKLVYDSSMFKGE